MAYHHDEIMDHYNQSAHWMSCNDKKKRGCIPLVMMERSIRWFSTNCKEKLAKAARVGPGVLRVRRTSS